MGVAARPSPENSEVEVAICGLRQLEAPLLPDCLSFFAVHAPVKEFLGGVNVLAILSDSARVHDVLMGVARYGADNLYATKAIDVGGVYKGNINIVRLSVLADVANGGVGHNLVVGAVRAALTASILRSVTTMCAQAMRFYTRRFFRWIILFGAATPRPMGINAAAISSPCRKGR